MDAIWSHLMEHGPTYLLVVVGLAIQSVKGAQWLDARFRHLNGDVGEIKAVMVDSGLATLVDKTDGQGKRLAVAVKIHTHRRVNDADEEETPT